LSSANHWLSLLNVDNGPSPSDFVEWLGPITPPVVRIGLADRVLHLEFSSIEQRKNRHNYAKLALLIGAWLFWYAPAESRGDLLVADRLSYSVFRYSDTGALLNTVIDHSLDIYQADGIALSPDSSQLYVASSLANQVMRYDYNAANGTVSNGAVFADASDGLSFPNDIKFSPDGSTIYIANLSSIKGGVARFHTDGTSTGSKLQLSTPDYSGSFQATSMAFLNGKLLVGVFADPLNTGGGGVAISDASLSTLPEYLIPPATEINGATGLMIHGGFLHVSGLQSASGNIERFALADDTLSIDGHTLLSKGQMDTAWEISGVPFPQQLAAAPDGNGFFAGVLGAQNGEGRIDRYAFDGTLLGTFISHATTGESGFIEATAFTFVPTSPAGIIGDFNNDGAVNAADYVAWRKASPTATLPNDDTPGVIDASDYADWRANFGKSVSGGLGGAGSAVPEPKTVLLLLMAIVVGSIVRSRN
jgi:hypothetical protein